MICVGTEVVIHHGTWYIFTGLGGLGSRNLLGGYSSREIHEIQQKLTIEPGNTVLRKLHHGVPSSI
jgi:hypothetical protein